MNYFNNTIEQKLRVKFNEYAITEASLLRMRQSNDVRLVFDAKNVEKIILDVDLHRILGQLRISSRKCRENYEAGLISIDSLLSDIDEVLEQ